MTDHKKFFKACKTGLLNDVKRFFTLSSVNVNVVDHNGWTALSMTAALGRKDIAELLISKGADINAKDIQDHTPLNEAASEGHKEVVESLTRTEGSWLQVLK